MSKDITLFIPTKNRTKFLNRVLEYYNKINFEGILAIGDSSTGEALKKNNKLFESYKESLNITYKTYPNKNLCQTSHELLKGVTTEFVAEVHDDNFVIPDSINKCIKFLNNNPDYSAARGLGVSIKTKNDEPHGKLVKCVKKEQPSSEHETASLRFQNLYGDYSDIHYAVHRTKIYREVLRNSHIRDNNFFHIMTTAITFILGKVKVFDTLHLVRHIQSPVGRRVFNKNHPESNNTYWWLTSKEWNSNLTLLQESIVNSLMKIDGIDKDNAQNTFELCFFMYYSMYFGNKTYNVKELKKYYDKYYGTALFPRWHEANDDMFFKILSYFYTRIRYYFEKIKNKILFREVLNNNMLSKDTNLLLPSLLNKKSKYHKNFIPIYETIVNQPNNNIEW